MSAAEGNGQKACPRGGGESVQQGRSIACCVPQGATVVDARSVHFYVSMATGRERHWRLFSTFPYLVFFNEGNFKGKKFLKKIKYEEFLGMRSQLQLLWTFFNLETAVGGKKEEQGIV